MKKIILLVLIAFLLTGCDAVYQVEIKNGEIVETANFLAADSDNISFNSDSFSNPNAPKKSLDELIDDYYKQDYLAFYDASHDKDFYKKEKITYEGRKGVQLKYTYSFDDYYSSSLVQYCFDDVTVQKNGIYLIFDLKDSTKCFAQDVNQLLKSLRVQILAKDVIETNADSVSGDAYIWNLSINDPNKAIYLKARVRDSITLVDILGICIGSFIVSFLIVCKVLEKKYKK